MGDNKGERTSNTTSSAKKQLTPPQHQIQHQEQQQPQQQISSSPKNPLEQDQSIEIIQQKQKHNPFISTPAFLPIGLNPKKPRFNTTSSTISQWKLLPSSHTQTSPISPPNTTQPLIPPPAATVVTTASSSETPGSTPPHSPLPSLSTGSGQGQTITKPEDHFHQFRKGKYVSPVWKPNEMLWLARAWRNQYQGGGSPENTDLALPGNETRVLSTRGKTRAEKDREVAEFLNRQGINRDAKTAGTKWDNMLGEFRKVYEWERGGEREQMGKSYFRLSPYERKIHRLPASFDEEVFEELSQFMGPRMRAPQSRAASVGIISVAGGSGDDTSSSRLAFLTRALPPPPPPPYKDDDLSLSGRGKQLGFTSGGIIPLGFDPCAESSTKDLRRIGKIRMSWEESVSLWAEEGEFHRGRVKLQGSSFLNADELTFFDDSMVACTLEAFEDGCFKGFSVDRFLCGQQVKVFGRRKSSSSASISNVSSSGHIDRVHQIPDPYTRSMLTWEFQDPTEYYLGCLRVPPTTLPSLFELSWHLQEPPPEELRFPLRRDVYRDLPAGKESFFTTSPDLLDCRSITYDILSPIMRTNPNLSFTSRDSLIGLYDDCINRVVSRFCSVEMVVMRKPSFASNEPVQDQWPNLTGFVKNLCLWRGEESDISREGAIETSSSIVEKLFWSYHDLPYLLGYYTVGYTVTFCALSQSQDRIIRTDLYSLDLSSPTERLKALVPCYRIAGLLPLLADQVISKRELCYSDFYRIDGKNYIIETTPNTVSKTFTSKRKFTATKEIYDFLDHRVPHAEFIHKSSEKDLSLTFKPRGCNAKPTTIEQLLESLKCVTKALVALHDLSFMHRDLSWDKVMKRVDQENEWFVCGFEEAVGAPQIYPQGGRTVARGKHAPEMGRGLHGVKVDVWGVGYLVKTSGLSNVPKMLKELQNRCLEQNPEQRPTSADCYHHLLQVQSAGATY